MDSLIAQIVYLVEILKECYEPTFASRVYEFETDKFYSHYFEVRKQYYSPEELALVSRYSEPILEIIKKVGPRCRRSFVHGDLNEMNIIAKNGDVSGFIDFSDLVESYQVAEIANFIFYYIIKLDSLSQMC